MATCTLYYFPEERASFGPPGSLPLLQHGDLKMAQSAVIENYLPLAASPDLTPSQGAIVSMFCCIKEDVVQGDCKVYFGWDEMKAKAPAELLTAILKWFTVMEGLLPADGFMLGGAAPSAADLAVLNLVSASHLFGGAIKTPGVDMEKTFPKMVAVSAQAAESPSVATYLAASTTFMVDPMGFNK